MLTYDGVFPGPTVISRRGRRTVVRHRNELPVPTAVHLHGGHTPADSDGYPTDLLLPVGGWDHVGHTMLGDVKQGVRQYVYPCDQRAATLWYHDHRMDFTGPQVYRGLAGFHLVLLDSASYCGDPTRSSEAPHTPPYLRHPDLNDIHAGSEPARTPVVSGRSSPRTRTGSAPTRVTDATSRAPTRSAAFD